MVITFLFSLLRNLQAMASPAQPRRIREFPSRIPPPNYVLGATAIPSGMTRTTAMASAVRKAKRLVTRNPDEEAYSSEFDALVMALPPGYPNIPAFHLWNEACKKAQRFQARMSARPKTVDGLLLPLAAGNKSPLSSYRTDAHQLQEPARNTKHRIATPELPVPDSKSRKPEIGFVTIEDEPFEFDPDAQPIIV